MGWISTTVALATVILFTMGGSRAQTVDCRHATTTIGETICGDKALTEKEAELSGLYRDILRRSDQQQHDQLIEEQRRWSAERDAACANRLSLERKACIGDMVSHRMGALAAKAPPQTPAQAGSAEIATSAARPFEGHWESCQKSQSSDICGYYTLFQNGDRICGTWQYYATGFYNGDLIWAVNGKAADWNYICGRVGAETSQECVGNDPPGHAVWETKSGSQYICSKPTGRYLQALEESCSTTPRHFSLRWRALDGKQRELPKTTTWLAECLNNPAYPDKSRIVAPMPR